VAYPHLVIMPTEVRAINFIILMMGQLIINLLILEHKGDKLYSENLLHAGDSDMEIAYFIGLPTSIGSGCGIENNGICTSNYRPSESVFKPGNSVEREIKLNSENLGDDDGSIHNEKCPFIQGDLDKNVVDEPSIMQVSVELTETATVAEKLNSLNSIVHAENGCLAVQDSAKSERPSPASVDVGFLRRGFLKPRPSRSWGCSSPAVPHPQQLSKVSLDQVSDQEGFVDNPHLSAVKVASPSFLGCSSSNIPIDDNGGVSHGEEDPSLEFPDAIEEDLLWIVKLGRPKNKAMRELWNLNSSINNGNVSVSSRRRKGKAHVW